MDLPGRVGHWEARVGFGVFNVPVLLEVLNPPSWEPVGCGERQAVRSHQRGIQPRQCSIPAMLCPNTAAQATPLSLQKGHPSQLGTGPSHHSTALGVPGKPSWAHEPCACARWLRVKQQPQSQGLAWHGGTFSGEAALASLEPLRSRGLPGQGERQIPGAGQSPEANPASAKALMGPGCANSCGL